MPSIFTEQHLPPWLETILRRMAQRSEAVSGAQYQPYMGQRNAQIPADVRKELEEGQRNLPRLYEENLRSANRNIEGANREFPTHYKKYMNPYINEVVNRLREEGMKTFKDEALPALEAKFVRLGQHGSSRHKDLASKAAKDIQGEILSRQYKALALGYADANSMFSSDNARKLEAADAAQRLGSMRHSLGLSGLAGIESQARSRQSEQQQGLETAYMDFLRNQDFARKSLQEQAAILHGISAPGTTAQYEQPAPVPQVNAIGQVGNIAGNILGAMNAFAPQNINNQQQQIIRSSGYINPLLRKRRG